MATSSSTSSRIELTKLPPDEEVTPPSLDPYGVTDNVFVASQLADASVPDGGYGWVVVFSCGVITFWFIGTNYSWGIVQAALLDEGLSTPSTLSFVGSLTVSCISAFALVNARLVRKWGTRWTGILGVLCVGGGEILTSFATHNLGTLFFTAGIVSGIGCSLCFIVVSVAPTQYFLKRRGLANGIVYAGGGFGGTVISFLMNGLIQSVGVPWMYRTLGILTLATGLPAAWLIKERAPIRTAGFIEWKLFRDSRFSILFFAAALGVFPLFVPAFFLPLYSASLGLSATAGAGLVAGFNFSSAIGRIACGFACDRIGPLNVLFLSLLVSALSMLVIWPISTSLAPLVLFVILNGGSNGGFFSTIPTVVGSMFGSARVSVCMGMIVTGWLGGYLMGAPIAGYLLMAYGGEHSTLQAYHPAIFYAGSLALAAAGLVLLIRLRISVAFLEKL